MAKQDVSKLVVDKMSEIIHYSKYARYLPEKRRRETFHETVERNKSMHIKKFPHLKNEIEKAFRFVDEKKVLPSMRSFQFAGKAIEVNASRLYNCSAIAVDHWHAFSEVMFLLLSGTGVGFSVQKHHVDKLPEIVGPRKDKRRYVIDDSIEGWSNAIRTLMKAYFFGKATPVFDYSNIRPKGARLVTSGGKAPGPEPLRACLNKIDKLLNSVISSNNGKPRKLKPIEVHDIMCIIADAVLAGGIRRAAMISLFSLDDKEMLTAKSSFIPVQEIISKEYPYYTDVNGLKPDTNRLIIAMIVDDKKHVIELYRNEDGGFDYLDDIENKKVIPWFLLYPYRGRANNSVVLPRDKVTQEDFDKIFKIMEESGSGEPGFFWTNDLEQGTNPCFTGDTKILTENGPKPLKSLEGQIVKLYNYKGQLVNAKVWSNGVKKVVKVQMADDSIVCTEDHRFMLQDGTECEAKDLAGKRIRPYYKIRSQNKDELVKLGFDSSTLPERGFPSTYDEWSLEQKASFLRGLYSANGCIIRETRISFKSTSKELIYKLSQTLKDDFGIDSYVTTIKSRDNKFPNGAYTMEESYDLNISKLSGIIRFAEKIAFVHEYKNNSLEELIIVRSPFVYKVAPAGEEEVFDFSLSDDTHWGIVFSQQGKALVAHNCAEVSLSLSGQFCNLTTINGTTVESQDDLNDRARAAAFIGTLQATYTDFHFLREKWKQTTERDYLIGVSITGIASGRLNNLDLNKAAEAAKEENERVAKLVGIKPAARVTTLKPEGTSSLLLSSSSGIHPWYSHFYIRNIRVNKNEPLYKYLKKEFPVILTDDYFAPESTAVISFPIKAPDGALTRHDETAIEMLERVKKYNLEWIQPGHRSGVNYNNVSVTVYVRPEEWNDVRRWMWENRNAYTAISLLPHDGGTYIQAPHEDITESEYYALLAAWENADKVSTANIIEDDDNTDLQGELACAGGACEVTSV